MATTALTTLLSTPVDEPLQASSYIDYLTAPPWHNVPGTFNFRNASYYPLVKDGIIYRSGLLTSLSEEGKKRIVCTLGVKAIFDLRFHEEIEIDNAPTLNGVVFHHAQLNEAADGNTNWDSLTSLYISFLETHKINFTNILLHILNNPGEPCLIHCTVGKDRTAVAVALVLALAGVPRDVIAHDYSLTRIGIEPVREMLLARLGGGNGMILDWNNVEVKMLAQCRANIMLDFLAILERKFEHGAEGYVVNELGFTAKEVDNIRKNLRS